MTLDEIKNQQAETLKKLYDFVGVESSFIPPNLGKKANSAKASKFTFISTLMGWFSAIMVALRLSKIIHWLKEKGFKNWVMGMNSTKIDYPPMSAKSRAFILNKTNADVEQLEQLLGRKFEGWKK